MEKGLEISAENLVLIKGEQKTQEENYVKSRHNGQRQNVLSDMTFMSANYNKVIILPSMEHRLKDSYNMVKSFTFNRISTWSLPLQLICSKSATKDITF